LAVHKIVISDFISPQVLDQTRDWYHEVLASFDPDAYEAGPQGLETSMRMD